MKMRTGNGRDALGSNAAHVIRYAVPPIGEPPKVADMTSTYRETIVRGLSNAGRISPSKFWRLPTLADTRVFVGAREPTDRIRASIGLLWDFSSSQSSFTNDLVRSIQMIGPALQRLNIKVWAGAYTTASSGTGIFEVNDWNERWDHRRVTGLMQVRMGGTPTGTALNFVRRYIMPKAPDHQRRLLLVCTDGQPGDPRRVKVELDRLRGQRVVVCGLYVGTNPKGGEPTLSHEYGRRFAFDVTHERIPYVFNSILERMR